MRLLYSLILILTIQLENSSCQNRKPTIVHVKFCDYLNDVSNDSDRLQGILAQSKSLHYVIEGSNPVSWRDTALNAFIGNDSFLRQEIQHKYYSLTLCFYKKTRNTDALLALGNDKFLSDCNMDIVVEYEWTNGVLTQLYHYHDGIIEGAENIKLEDVH